MAVAIPNADLIATTLSLPDEFEPLRIADSYAATPMALAKTNVDIKLDWTNAVVDGNDAVPVTDMLVFQFRNPLRWLVVYDNNHSHTSYTYNWIVFGNNDPSTLVPPPGGSTYYPVTAGVKDVANTYNPHGDIYFAGEADGIGYMWVDGTDTQLGNIVITWVGATSPTTPPDLGAYTIRIWQWSVGEKLLNIEVVNGGTLTDTAPITSYGYYAVEVVVSNPGAPNLATTFSVSSNSTAPTFRHLSVPDLSNNLNRIQSISMTASSLLWRNVASYDNAQGDVGAVNIGAGYEFWHIIEDGNGYNTLSQNFTNGWKSFFAAKGIYGFLRPSDEEDLEMKIPVSGAAPGSLGTWGRARFNLRDTSPYKAFAMSVSLANGRETMLRAAAHMQYETNDPWADVRPAVANVDDWLTACKKLAYIDDISENPSHVTNVLTRVGILGQKGLNVASAIFSNPVTSKIPVVKEGLGLVKNLTIPTVRRGLQLIQDIGEGNFTKPEPTMYPLAIDPRIIQERRNVDPRQEETGKQAPGWNPLLRNVKRWLYP